MQFCSRLLLATCTYVSIHPTPLSYFIISYVQQCGMWFRNICVQQHIELNFISVVQVVVATCAAAGNSKLLRKRFQTLIVDEASQITEPVTLIGMVHLPHPLCAIPFLRLDFGIQQKSESMSTKNTCIHAHTQLTACMRAFVCNECVMHAPLVYTTYTHTHLQAHAHARSLCSEGFHRGLLHSYMYKISSIRYVPCTQILLVKIKRVRACMCPRPIIDSSAACTYVLFIHPMWTRIKAPVHAADKDQWLISCMLCGKNIYTYMLSCR